MPKLRGKLPLRRLLALILRRICKMRRFTAFSLNSAHYRIASDRTDEVIREIRRLWGELETFIADNPEFAASYSPIEMPRGSQAGGGSGSGPAAHEAARRMSRAAPEAARRMICAAKTAGVGPMAAVAGTFAQMAAEAAVRSGAAEAIVENGGDIYLYSKEPVTVGIYTGGSGTAERRLAFAVSPKELPIALCSSSSTMGHSTSFGDCDLATVTAKDASLADAAATRACNMVQRERDIPRAAEFIASLPGISGVFIVKGDKIGMAGSLPRLVTSKL
jgi:hypothetical protein